jgi:tRNA threonylcarbamoyladenosine biosynthesis protein TsaE
MLIVNKDSAEAMESFGAVLGQSCVEPLHIYLQGQLGAGKTTLVRGFLRGKGYKGKVKSPTFTLIEAYEFPEMDIFHFDLYRLEDPEELVYIGFRDYFEKGSSVLLEWPEKAGTLLADPDITINIQLTEQGRRLDMHGLSSKGQDLLNIIQ